MYLDDKDFYIHNHNDVITISALFKVINGSIQYLSKEDFAKIRAAIFGGKTYGNN
jgi:hypothetical protein